MGLNRINNLIDTDKNCRRLRQSIKLEFLFKQHIPNQYTHVYHLYPLVRIKIADECLNYSKKLTYLINSLSFYEQNYVSVTLDQILL